MICHRYVSILILYIGLALAINSGGSIQDAIAISVIDTGAKGDGKTLDTLAIQSAIDQTAERGGGTVYFPPGRYVSGTILLKNHITLYFANGAVLLGSRTIDDYPDTIPSIRSYTDNYVRKSLIYGENLTDVSLRGPGTIDGQGDAFHWKEYLNRPYVIRLISCRRIVIQDITLMSSPMWMQHYLACEDVFVHNIHVFNHGGYNNDGIDFDSCKNVRMSDCTIDSDDDALCLKSTTDIPCEDITITNCVLSSHCNAIKTGTESNGGFKNITISNCAIHSPRETNHTYGAQRGLAGIALEIVDGGTLDRVAISNITMEGVSVPIFLRLGNRSRPYRKDGATPSVGAFQHVSISNIIATGVSKTGCSITGLPDHPMRDISLHNIFIEFEGGGELSDTSLEVPERETAYPESTMFGMLPAYGFYCRHVNDLHINQVVIRYVVDEERSGFIFDDVKNLTLASTSGESPRSERAFVLLHGVSDAFLHANRLLSDGKLYLQIQGNTNNITCIGNELTKADTAFVIDDPNQIHTLFQYGNRTKQSETR